MHFYSKLSRDIFSTQNFENTRWITFKILKIFKDLNLIKFLKATNLRLVWDIEITRYPYLHTYWSE